MPAPELTIQTIKTVAASQNRAAFPSFAAGLKRYLRLVPETRPVDWQVRVRFGPISLYHPVEGWPTLLRSIAGRHTVEYRVRRWPLALLRVLRAYVLGDQGGRGQTTEIR